MTEHPGSPDTPAPDGPAMQGFFMHIAKTAGSYVNSLFAEALGPRFVEHCEAPGRLDITEDVALMSGHLYLHQWLQIEAAKGWTPRRFTLLREPLGQLASHIQWLDHYAQDDYRDELAGLDPGTQEVVRQIAGTDLSDAGDVDRFLTTLSGKGVMYLDNCQARYFIALADGIGPETPLHYGMRPLLASALMAFDAVGTNADIPGFVARVSGALNLPEVTPGAPVNAAKSQRAIDLADGDMRQVLGRRCMLDLWLYDRVRNSPTGPRP